MKKERKPLTTREKVLIGLSIAGAVATCAAGYFGYKYWENLKDSKALEAINDDLLNGFVKKDDELECVKEELNLVKYLLIEGDILPKAVQNGGNKIARKENKIKGIVEAIKDRPNDKTLINALQQHEREYDFMKYQQGLAEQLQIKIDNDECIYAK